MSAAILTAEGQKAAQRRTLLVLSTATILGGLGVGASLSVGAPELTAFWWFRLFWL